MARIPTQVKATDADRPAEETPGVETAPAVHPFDTLKVVRGGAFIPKVHARASALVENLFKDHPIFVHTSGQTAKVTADFIRDVRKYAKGRGKPVTIRHGSDKEGNPGVQFSTTEAIPAETPAAE